MSEPINTLWINIPVYYKYNFNHGKIFIGAYAGFKVNETKAVQWFDNNIEAIKSFNYGVRFGGAWTLSNLGAVYMEYDLGLANLIKTEGPTGALSSITLGYSHPLKLFLID